MGKWGLKLSEISIGTMYYGSTVPEDKALLCLREALNQGINYIDCADRYGIYDSDLPMDERVRAESILGKLLRDYDRDDLVIGTKLHYQMRESVNSGGLGRKHIREGIRDSLKYLGTDYVDIYYCHRPDRSTALEEVVSTMSGLIDEGIVHYWGTSWWPPALIERTIGVANLLGAHPPQIEESPYCMLSRQIERRDETMDVAKHHGMGLATFEALAMGLLTGKYVDGVPPGSRFASMDISQEVLSRYNEKSRELVETANALDITLAQLALAWTLRRGEVTTSIMGATKPEQVRENAQASEVELDDGVLDRIEDVLRNQPVSWYK